MFDNQKPQKEDISKPTHNINNMIKAREVLLINENGEKVGVVPTREALYKSEAIGLDLVEVNSGKVPVCKIMDYKKIQYEQKKLAKKNAHHHVKETKEIRFTSNTEQHDINIKAKHIREFLDEGHKVRLTVKFKGREGSHTELGANVINKALDTIGRENFNIDQPINLEGNNMGTTISSKKV